MVICEHLTRGDATWPLTASGISDRMSGVVEVLAPCP
jgi:hypothetical protein